MSPQRIQRKRTKGWTMPENTIYVGRGSKWGNPFTMGRFREMEREMTKNRATDAQVRRELVDAFRSLIMLGPDSGFWTPSTYQSAMTIGAGIDAGELDGKNLACWCPLDQQCHADVLLAIVEETRL